MSSSFPHLEAAAANDDVEALESHREIASGLAKTLSELLLAQANRTDDMNHWCQELSRLAADGQRGPFETLIMVVGSMGAGKSTAINALLGEPRLLPTSGYDACTSVATEVRYNHSMEPDEAYRAEITFITKQELLDELRTVRDDVVSCAATGEAAYGTTTPDDAPFEIAWAKMQAVWPNLTRAQVAEPGFDIGALLRDRFLRGVLGQTIPICHPTATELCRDLEKFVANRDNVSPARRADGVSVEQQYWPLVERVVVFVKAEVLSTGAVIKDMPGGRDGNSARSARAAAADGDKCDHLCVLVPVKRAISEQIVKKPFNDASTFKNWIKFDGRLDGITYVCTMTDDAIEIDRDAEKFGLAKDFEEFKRLEDDLDARETALAETWEQYEALQDNSPAPLEFVASRSKYGAVKRKGVFASQSQGDKRLRRNPLPPSSGGRSQTPRHDMERFSDSGEILESEIDTSEAKELASKIHCLETHCGTLQRQVMEKKFFLRGSCIQGRNALTRSAIQQDFIHAAKELLSHKRGTSTGNGWQGFDVVELFERKPPTVHTVSASGYFRSLKRRRTAEFWTAETMELSGIPAWRDHIKQLTIPARRRKCRAFLRAALNCFIQISIWCDNGSGISLTSEQGKAVLADYKYDLYVCVEKLDSHIEEFISRCRKILDRLFSEEIKAVLPEVVRSAAERANNWASRRIGDKKMTSGSYRTACKNGGVYEGRGQCKNPWDLNEELAQPLIDEIDDQCKLAFENDFPDAFENLRTQCAHAIFDLTDEAESRLRCNMTESARQKLRDQMRAQKKSIHGIVEDMEVRLKASRKEIRDQLTSALKDQMTPIWKKCVGKTGPGSFGAQQRVVEDHLRDDGEAMYITASSRVQRSMTDGCSSMNTTLSHLKDSVAREMLLAYTATIVAKDDGALAVREEVRKRLAEADGRFKNPPPLFE